MNYTQCPECGKYALGIYCCTECGYSDNKLKLKKHKERFMKSVGEFIKKWEDHLYASFSESRMHPDELFSDVEYLWQVAYEKGLADRVIWQKEKPDYPCIFLARTKYNGNYDYSLWFIEKTDSAENDNEYYLGIYDSDHEEWGDLAELTADEYFIIEPISIEGE